MTQWPRFCRLNLGSSRFHFYLYICLFRTTTMIEIVFGNSKRIKRLKVASPRELGRLITFFYNCLFTWYNYVKIDITQ